MSITHIDMSYMGKKNGLLTVTDVRLVGPTAWRIFAVCECGKEARPIQASTWRRGLAKSCGNASCTVLARERNREEKKRNAQPRKRSVDGDIYHVVQSMKWVVT